MRNDLTQLTSQLKKYITPESFMEVGSRDGKDTKYICEYWNINPSKVYIVEANIFSYKKIKTEMLNEDKIPFTNLIYGACSNKNEIIDFNCVLSDDKGLVGISSVKKHLNLQLNYHVTKVKSFRLDEFLKENQIDLFKIDVEGHAYEVIEGMGSEIKKVKAIQVETEVIKIFENQKIHNEVNLYLKDNGFNLIDKKSCWDSQLDCLYINKKLLN
jgi:FkbM family methyltransferase